MSEDERWQRLQELFDGLITQAPAQRASWLQSIDADAALKREALALVAAEEGGKDNGVTAQLREAAARIAASRVADQRLGAYRLIEEIGSGGMGTVFLAERVDRNFEQRVAIKLLRGIPTRDAIERMRRERQILADLAHPHVARLLDGGNTSDGQPYLVMEYIDGVPLNLFCRRHDLGVAARLGLIQKICAAVHYAHQRLIIHRDLKPANVLVRADGEPILLDFGIAKLLVDTAADAQQTALPWFTPAYASPEQRSGQRVGTGADVYGLGALLYELLADSLPQTDANGHLPPPSRVAAAASSKRRIGADLDLIVAKAMHADPQRRYDSAAALAEDLQRHLRGRPIHAAPDRLHYRAAKFIARHRLASAAAVATIALCVLFTVRLASERDRALRAEALAQQHSATAQSVVDYLISLFHSASPEETGTKAIAPRELVDRGRREIDARLANAPEQRARLLGAFGKIYTELGLPDAAAHTFADAAAIERDHGSPTRRAAFLADQGYALNLAERSGAAEAVLLEAEALLGTIDPDERRLAAELLSTLGLARARNGDTKAGIESLRRALGYATQSEGADSVLAAQCLYGLAEAELRANQLDAAETDALRSVALMRQHKPEDSTEVLAATGFLSEVYEQQGRYADGERLLRGMLEVRLRTLDPASAWAITVRNNLAQAIQLQGRIVEATALLQQNVDYLRSSRQQQTPSYLISINNLGSLLEQAGDYETSLAMFTEVLQRAGTPSDANDDPHLPTYRQNLGRSLMLNGRLDAARPLLDAEIEGSADSVNLNIERGRRLLHLAEWMRRSSREADALHYVEQASTLFATLYPGEHPRHGAIARTRGLILRDQHRLADAEIELRRAAGILARTAGKDANATIDAELQWADVLLALGRADEARALHARITPLLPTRFVEHSALREQHAALAQRLEPASVVRSG